MQGKLADGAHNSCHSFVRIRDRNLDPSVWRDKSTNTLMIQSQNRQAVPHRLQDLHAVGIAQAGKEESICTSIQGRHFAPGHSTLFSRCRAFAHFSHVWRISPSPAITSLARMSRASANASSAKGKAFRGNIRPTQSKVNVSPFALEILVFRIKSAGIPESSHRRTSLAPRTLSKSAVSWFVASATRLALAVFRRNGENRTARRRTLLRTSRFQARPK